MKPLYISWSPDCRELTKNQFILRIIRLPGDVLESTRIQKSSRSISLSFIKAQQQHEISAFNFSSSDDSKHTGITSQGIFLPMFYPRTEAPWLAVAYFATGHRATKKPLFGANNNNNNKLYLHDYKKYSIAKAINS